MKHVNLVSIAFLFFLFMNSCGNTKPGASDGTISHARWETPEIYDGIDYYTYNTKAHPQLSKPGELLISYNVNSFQFEKDLKAYPNFYHPRFITVKL